MALKVGDTAPDFELPAVQGDQHVTVKLSEYLGKQNVVVTFHPLDWTPTCAAQVPAFDSDREKFAALNAQVIDISVDSIPSKLAWQKKELGMMSTPMCADFYPHGRVSQMFDVFRDQPPFPESASAQLSLWINRERSRLRKCIRSIRRLITRNY